MKSKILGLLAVGLLAGPITAKAVTLQVSGGILTGATGVIVNGQLFDVAFLDGTCAALFSGCNDVADSLFQTYTAAQDASLALIQQVFVNNGQGAFDDSPSLTQGCTSVSACFALTPYLFSSGFVRAVGADNWSAGNSDSWSQTYNLAYTTDTSPANTALNNSIVTWAVWSPHRVPEPGTLALLGLGLAGLGLSRRRKAA